MNISQTVALYNAIPNLFWTVVNLLPISVFCYSYVKLTLLFIFLAIGILTLFLPPSFFNAIQLGESVFIYKKLGVHWINKYTQNGTIINQLIRRKFPDYKMVSKRSVRQLVGQSYMLEKFHFMMFTLFIIITFYGFSRQYYAWAVILVINNILYNVYPCLLQQYIRIRLKNQVASTIFPRRQHRLVWKICRNHETCCWLHSVFLQKATGRTLKTTAQPASDHGHTHPL